ncbi:glycosyl hydrolase family 61-domain-containing protein [Mycena leptocephala]|nr:glycosyl hydrolase family 61-domain-containing protein [Mycena leptocephala]
MVFKIAALSVLATLPSVLAHGGVLSYLIGGTIYKGWTPYNTPVGQTGIERPWAVYDPILDPMSPQLACNDDGTSGALQLTANVKLVLLSPHTGIKFGLIPLDPWFLTYLALCPGTTCTGVNAATLKWFKIDQSGLINGTVFAGYWGSGKMIDQNSSWTTTIPATVPNGNYLLRFETIALHSLPAQFYPECAQIAITGGGTLAPTAAQLVSFPGAYSSTDPGLNIDIYSNQAQVTTTYVIPGPPMYGVAVSPPSSTTTTKSSSTSTTTSSAPTGTPGTVAQFGQCGGTDTIETIDYANYSSGSGYTGATGCKTPFVCTVINGMDF